jgi:hypothetical protein
VLSSKEVTSPSRFIGRTIDPTIQDSRPCRYRLNLAKVSESDKLAGGNTPAKSMLLASKFESAGEIDAN